MVNLNRSHVIIAKDAVGIQLTQANNNLHIQDYAYTG